VKLKTSPPLPFPPPTNPDIFKFMSSFISTIPYVFIDSTEQNKIYEQDAGIFNDKHVVILTMNTLTRYNSVSKYYYSLF
jgi:hypothetical protein